MPHRKSDPIRPIVVARGTRDLTERAWAAANVARGSRPLPLLAGAIAPDLSLRHKVELVLREAMLNAQQIARAIREPVGRVTTVLRLLREEHLLFNAGTHDHPQWVLRIGDDASTLELRNMVRRLLKHRPMTSKELALATGARVARVSRAITTIRQEGDAVVRSGSQHDGRWFIASS